MRDFFEEEVEEEMPETPNLPALQKRISDVVDEYNKKLEDAERELKEFKEATTKMNLAGTIGGTYGNGELVTVYGLDKRKVAKSLLISGWRNIYDGLNIKDVATAKDIENFERSIQDPPELTMDNVTATLGRYVENPRASIVRGLAEAFCQLDQSYKSHSKVKIGVEGLPKRVIISGVNNYDDRYGAARVRDALRSLCAVRGVEMMDRGEFMDWLRSAENENQQFQGVTIKRFMNGNAHLMFDRMAQDDINKGLAEFYGDVLPDTPDENPTRKASTELAKDLQYFGTPSGVARRIVSEISWRDGGRVLEPSCGEGALLEALRDHLREDYTGSHRSNPEWKATGIECDLSRVQAVKAKGFNVVHENFLECDFDVEFERILMNPPFYGKHYLKHINHAIKFLKSGGVLISILPLTAWEDHKMLPEGGRWRELPFGSFIESGTNVNTGYWIYTKD